MSTGCITSNRSVVCAGGPRPNIRDTVQNELHSHSRQQQTHESHEYPNPCLTENSFTSRDENESVELLEKPLTLLLKVWVIGQDLFHTVVLVI